jgi:hypothetical protein
MIQKKKALQKCSQRFALAFFHLFTTKTTLSTKKQIYPHVIHRRVFTNHKILKEKKKIFGKYNNM